MKLRLSEWPPLTRLRMNPFAVRRRSEAVNVFHCCVHKTASQWLRKIFSDRRVYQWSGLTAFGYQLFLPGGYDPRKLTERRFDRPFPRRTIAVGIYLDYPCYASIPKPGPWRTFFVMRDPRDLVVSLYFSNRYSHALMGRVGERREMLNAQTMAEGLRYVIEHTCESGQFRALESWIGAPERDPQVLLTRYEDLVGPESFAHFRQVFDHCDIALPDDGLRDVLDTYSFQKMTGRKKGQEDQGAHMRKGVAGDWKNHFDTETMAYFQEKTGDLVQRLGYGD